VSFGDRISPEAHRQVLRLTHNLEGLRPIRNLHPAFTSVLVEFDPRLNRQEEIESLIRDRIPENPGPAGEAPPEAARRVEIPVRYGGEFGPDLEDVARHAGISAARVVELHASADYLVYFLGFATFFVYLGGLPARIAAPRLAAPRRHVPAGSVGIAGSQTGIYPMASPGGWRIVGRTDLRLLDLEAAPPPLVRMGDRVRFVPVGEVRS
jgi:KipI family sensor histidine kinase inhibitor